MATMKTISAALKLVDAKKDNLRKAFDDLQAHSSSLSSFTLTWPDLDSHFSSLQSSLEHKFKILQSQQEQLQSQPSNPPQPSSSSVIVKGESESGSVPARPELRLFCEKMDGLGLRKYMIDRADSRLVIKAELEDALRRAPDAAKMVLDAMKGFYVPNSRKGDKDVELCAIRKNCVVLLEVLMGLKVEIGAEVREKAKNLADEWRGKVSDNGENPLEVLGFLHLVATYGLADGFSVEDLIDFVVVVARFHQAGELCRVLAFGDRISDVILKLVSKGKQLLAVKFIFEFKLSDKFPPVPLLKEYVKESKKDAKKIRKGGKNCFGSQKEATTKEVHALKSVIKIIDEHKLESEYPKEKLMNRMETLERFKLDKKQFEATPTSKTQQQSKLQTLSGSKRPRTNAQAGPAAIPVSVAATSPSVPAFQQSHLQPAGSLPEHPVPYLSTPAGVFGLEGSTPTIAPYAGSSAGFYSSAGAPMGVPGNLMPTQHYIYPSESQVPSGYYDRPIAYGGFAFPQQYHPPYYPQ